MDDTVGSSFGMREMKPDTDVSNVSPTTEATPASVDRQTRAAAKRFAGEHRWDELLILLQDRDDLANYPALLALRLRAAIELSDAPSIERCHAVIRQTVKADGLIVIVTIMVRLQQPIHAARVLEALPPEYRTIATTQIAQRIAKIAPDRAMRRRLARFVGPRTEMQARIGVHDVPGADEPPIVPPSDVTIVRLAGVSADIEAAIARMHVDFRAALGTGPSPTITEYRDVFTNPVGEIWTAEGDVLQSSGRTIAIPADPASVPVLDEAFGFVGRHKGYFEWLVRRMGGLNWRLAPGAPDCPILIRKEQHGLAMEALGALGVAAETIVRLEGTVFCRRLYTGNSTLATMARRGGYRHINEKLVALADRDDDHRTPRRFYISRRDSSRRSMVGEPAFEQALEARGIVPVVLSTLGLLDKIRLFRNAELVVGAHGAGFSHLIFANPGLRVVEILPIPETEYKLLGVQTCFMRLSVVFGHRHTLVLQPMQPGTTEWSPDMAEIDRVLAMH